MATKASRTKASASVLQLRIELLHTRPRIWRQVLVPDTITMQQLHLLIQCVFEWSGSHLHEFSAGEERYGPRELDVDPPGSIRSERSRLTSALMHAPPDDCGGVPGYDNFMQAMADPGHPAHEEMKEWIGGDWDPTEFDIDRINRWLAEFKF